MAHKYINSCYKLISQANAFKQPINHNLKCLSRYHNEDKSKKPVDEIKPSVIDYEVSRSKEEWSYVERVLPPKVVPKPIPRESYKTHWRPPTAKPGAEKYYIERNRNYMLPVHLTSTHRGMRKITEIRKVHGDIYALHDDLVNLIKESVGKDIASQVNELVGCINIKGDHYRLVLQFLTDKGF